MLNEKFDSIASAVKDRNIQNDHAPNCRSLEFKWASMNLLKNELWLQIICMNY